MQKWYSLKVTDFDSKFDKECMAKIVFEDLPSELGDYVANLQVTWKGETTNFMTTFVAMEVFPPFPTLTAIDDTLVSGKTVFEIDIPRNYAFLTLAVSTEAYQQALDLFGPAAAQRLFHAVNDWGFLEACHQNPVWFQHEKYAEWSLDSVAEQVFYDEHIIQAKYSAATIFQDFLFGAQIMAEELIEELDNIPVGNDDGEQHRDATAFEQWCEKTIKLLVLYDFSPVKLHVNGRAFNRRDLVAVNLGRSDFGKRILSDYGVRSLVLEVKNKYDINKPDIVQITNYLEDLYGRLGFIIYRSDALELGKVGAWWFRQIRNTHKKSIIELTTGMLRANLRYLMMKHGPVFDSTLCQLLNDYEHKHCNEPFPTMCNQCMNGHH